MAAITCFEARIISPLPQCRTNPQTTAAPAAFRMKMRASRDLTSASSCRTLLVQETPNVVKLNFIDFSGVEFFRNLHNQCNLRKSEAVCCTKTGAQSLSFWLVDGEIERVCR